MLKYIVNLFKKDNTIYECYLRKDAIIIVSKMLRENSIVKYDINPFEGYKLICETTMNHLPLHKLEKKVLKKNNIIYILNNNPYTITNYQNLITFLVDKTLQLK